jgi:hypothetical protein
MLKLRDRKVWRKVANENTGFINFSGKEIKL